MLVKILFTIAVFSASAHSQSRQPGFCLYQARPEARLEPSSIAAREARSSDAPTVVSFERLGHKPPRRARKAFRRGVQLSFKEQYAEAAAAFRQASEFDPEFSDAFTNLGLALMKSGPKV